MLLTSVPLFLLLPTQPSLLMSLVLAGVLATVDE